MWMSREEGTGRQRAPKHIEFIKKEKNPSDQSGEHFQIFFFLLLIRSI